MLLQFLRRRPRLSLLFTLCALLWASVDLTYPQGRLSYDSLTSTRFYAQDGTLLYERRSHAGGYGAPVELSQIAEPVLWATLAGEDHHFWLHPGVDPSAVGRAVWLNVQAGAFKYGGSSITQQLAKLIQPEPRTLGGKLREAFDAGRLEWTLTKEQILTQYLNRAYYGRQAYGIEAAARRFFNKSAAELKLDEGALLAILPRSPTGYDPERFPERAQARRAHVLSLMVARGFITEAQAQDAANSPLQLHRPLNVPQAPHAVDHLMQHHSGRGDVNTSLDLELQGRVIVQLNRHLRRIQPLGAEQAAVLILDNATRQVIAMVGSEDYSDDAKHGAVNATLAKRPAGSTLKPFIYALTFERGQGPQTLINDQPTLWADYQPRNPREHFQGWVTLERALGSSLNVPSVELLERLSVPVGAEKLHQLGFAEVDPSGQQHGLALALGAVPVSLLELAGAYATLADGGVYRAPKLTVNAQPKVRALSAEAAAQVTAVLSSNDARQAEFGLETPLDLPFPVAAKTGTSSAFCDNWTVGYTREVTVAVWVGNFDGRPLRGALAMRGAAPLFHDAMVEAMRRRDAALPLFDETAQRRQAPTDATSPLETAHAPGALRIGSPRDDSRFVLDPLLPAQLQRVPLRLAAHAKECPAPSNASTELHNDCIAQVRWQLDDETPFTTGTREQHFWSLRRGKHQLRATGLSTAGKVIAHAPPVSFTVTGADDV